ncbi:PAS domain S-box protein [Ktedonospora formicarum]|uniref:histidine kinase n=1 Tax=Ktedonospora formicarum TaxID=2778364 RepID=A0A8J3MWL0_9CHLR|nr:PAS domain S-box protein [Ktedonospora formicarum]GHO47705.1 hypothetical protein KSX_58680 [Ktedonospora formicarum]
MSNTEQTQRVTPASSGTLLPLLETLPGALFVVNDAAMIVYANASTQALLGVTREDVLGKPLWRGAPQLVSTALYQAVQQTRQTQAPSEVEYVSPMTRTWLHVQLAPTMGGLMVQVHQGRAAARRGAPVPQGKRLSIEDLNGLYSRIGVLTPEGIVLEINEDPLAEAGVRREEVIGQPLAEARWWSCTPASQEQLCAAIARASKGETVRFETVISPREGLDRHLEIAITPHRDADHHIAYLIIAGIDITERKRAEAEIHSLIDTIPQLVWTMRPDDSHYSCNQRWHDYTGMSPEEAQGEGWMQCLHPEDRQRVRSAWQHAVQTGGVYETELRLRLHTTGEYRWFLARALPVRDERGQIIKWFGTNTDIEEQKQAEEALRQSQERASVLMNSNIIGINIIEGEQIVDANDTFLRMTGYSREDLCKGRMNWLHMTAPDDLARTLEAHQELVTQQSLTPYEKEYVCKDGSCLPVLVGGIILEHHPHQAIGFVLDNSARKELEQRKDDFISMASHELRNPLTALKLHTTLLHRQLAKQGLQGSAPTLSSMETQINKVTRLVEELLDVSKIQAGRLEYVWETADLDALLREITNTMQQTHPSHRILVRGAVQTSLMADRDRLGQVFINLLSNAVKYSPSAEAVEMDLSASAESVTIRVQDHGLGIPREQRDKIFERFYRTADPKQRAIPGLGMGLYIVAEIVKRHKGTITVDSAVGKGSTFTVTLPKKRDA